VSQKKPESRGPIGSAALADEPVLVDVNDLHVHFAIRGGFADRLLGRQSGSVKAVDGVSFQLRRGEVLGLVGESGSGKTTLGRAILGLAPVTRGSVRFGVGADALELTTLDEGAFRSLRRRMQIVFQDPHASLNPAMDIATAVAHPLRIHGVTRDRAEIDARVRAALERVGLVPVDRYLHKYPSDLSGGQKQRAVLARAIMLGPELLVADEPVSMLDMSVRAKILQLMLDLKDDLGLSYLYITHDLATAKYFCDTIAIMYLGRIVEMGPADEIYADPKHPYTRSLLGAIPDPDPARAVRRDLPRGEVPDAARPPVGCSFHPRCPAAFGSCGWEGRDLRTLLEQRWTGVAEETYEAERSLVGELADVETGNTGLPGVAHVPAGTGHTGSEVAELLRTVRSADESEPLWSGVLGVMAGDGGVDVTFRPGKDPRLRAAGGTEVACLLYPDPGDFPDSDEPGAGITP
jgi:peptide/nickel transport system ATP-binding protein